MALWKTDKFDSYIAGTVQSLGVLLWYCYSGRYFIIESLMLRVLQGLEVGMKVVFDLLFFKALLLSGKLAATSR